MNTNSITVNPTGGANVVGSKVTIASAGNYRFVGSLIDGQVIVNVAGSSTVRLILNGVNVNCSNGPPIYVIDAKKVIIVLQEGTQNYLSDGTSYALDAGTDEPNAAIFSKSDLTIYGTGSLSVDAKYNDAITSKDGLIVKSGSITATSVDDGIRGKDYLIIKNGEITLNVGGDGLKSDNVEDVAKGYVTIENGELNIAARGDAIDAETDVTIADGNLTLSSGGGSGHIVAESVSAKGIKGNVSVVIDNGRFTIDSADDAIHSNGNLTINGGSFVLSTDDDACHADASVTINGGNINITKSYEGIESVIITINGGTIHVVSSDDGINGAGGNDSSGMDDDWWDAGYCHLYINGGYIWVDALGDGIDINGAVDMTNGTVLVNGPTSSMNGALDHDSFKITGGFLLAVGSTGMAQAPGSTSTQRSVMVYLNAVRQPNELITIRTSSGTVLFTFKATKQYQSIVYSSPSLTQGSTYDLYLGGSSTGTPADGLYIGGNYTPGSKYASFTITGIVTIIGGGGFFWP